VKKLNNNNVREKEANLSEIAFLSICDHPNIVEFHKAFLVSQKVKKNQKEKEKEKKKGKRQSGRPDSEDDGRKEKEPKPKDKKGNEIEYEIWIVMEYLRGGTLEQAARSQRLSDEHVAYVAREVLKALKYLHDLGFVHRDLKSSNIMLSVTGQVKLIDFGLCCDIRDGPRYQTVGSPYWIPPEMLKRQGHTYPADIWSLGVSLLELFLGHPPLKESTVKCMFTAATKGLAHLIPVFVSQQARDFLTKCLVMEPEKRATVDDLIKHPWVTRPKLDEGLNNILEQIFFGNTISTFVL